MDPGVQIREVKMAKIAARHFLGEASSGGRNVVQQSEGIGNGPEALLNGLTLHAFGRPGNILVDFREPGNRRCVGDSHEDDYALTIVAARVFGGSLLVTEDAVAVDTEHLVGEMVDCSGGVSIGTGIWDKTG
jgi:hypothetical protein